MHLQLGNYVHIMHNEIYSLRHAFTRINPYFLFGKHNCDRVCENQSCLHVKFDLILSLSNLTTLFPNIVLYQTFHHIHKIS